MSDLEAFRAETRAWLEANCPAEMRTPIARDADVCWGGRNAKLDPGAAPMAGCAWARAAGPRRNWPKDYGGGGLSKDEAKVLRQEMRRINARSPLSSFGIWMLGPALLEVRQRGAEEAASAADRARRDPLVPGLFGAGRRLRPRRRCRPRAEDKGDHYLVNGQKVWTSYADKADWIFCLVRTEPDAPKHDGITFLLFDMATPGVSTRADPADLRLLALLRDLLRRCEGAEGEPGRRARQGLGHRQVPAHPRARDDRRQ